MGHEIGGTCIELECGGQRLLLDLGRSLDDAAAFALPAVAGLATGDDPSLESLDAAEERDEVDELFEGPQ